MRSPIKGSILRVFRRLHFLASLALLHSALQQTTQIRHVEEIQFLCFGIASDRQSDQQPVRLAGIL